MGPKNHAVMPIQMREDLLRDPFFSSSWSEFEEDRNLMTKQTGDFWDKVESDMAKFEAGLADIERDMDKRMSPHQTRVPDWAIPEQHKHNWPITSKNDTNKEIQGFNYHSIRDAHDSWELEVDIGEYDPEGVKLSVAGDSIILRAGRSTLEMKPNNQSSYSQSIERRYTLPPGCDTDRLTSRLNNNNMLTVHCPRKFYLSGPSVRAIKSQR